MKEKHPNAIHISIALEAAENNIRKVMVALSGGADSIATAFALKKAGLEIIALHCNFHLRGKESDRDQEFVTQFCLSHKIPLATIDFNIEEYLKCHKGESVEMACRELRHEWFRNQLQHYRADRIATGHNADDNIETFFLNLLRGSGTRGLRGMDKDNGTIWRPLLSMHRAEIIDYLKENDLTYIVDSTNLQSDYRRNFLRNEVFPLIKQKWEGFEKTLDKTINNLNAENTIVEQALESILPLPLQPLSTSVILNSPAPLLVIKRFIDPLSPFTTTAEEILSAIKANKPHIRRWRLKKGYVFLRNGNLFNVSSI